MGLRPAAGRSTTPAGVWWTGALTRAWRSCSCHRADAGRRGPQRVPEPDAAAPPAPAGRHVRRTPAEAPEEAGPHDRRSSTRPSSAAEAAAGRCIDVRDLRVWYGTDPRPGPGRRRRQLRPARRARPSAWSGSPGCGKSTLGRGLIGLLPEGAQARRRSCCFRGRDMLALEPQGSAPAARAATSAMIFQEPLTRLNPLMRICEHFEETLKSHEPASIARTRSASARSRCSG